MAQTVRPWPNPPTDAAATIHQITDSHIGYSDPYATQGSWDKSKIYAATNDINSGFISTVDGLVHTGDITDDGGGIGPGEGAQDGTAIQWLASLYHQRPDLPTVICPGNHDLWDRVTNLGSGLQYSSQAWEHVYQREANGVTDIGEVRVVHFTPPTMDVNDDSNWRISKGRLEWIDRQCQDTHRPVVLATHYPLQEMNLQNGVASGGSSLSPSDEMNQIIESNPNVIGMLTGHRHLAASYVRVATVLTIGSRNIVHLCGPSLALSLYDGTAQYGQPLAPQYSLYVSILDQDQWQVRLRSHTPARWGDIDGFRIIELDRKAASVSHSNGRIPIPGAGRWDSGDNWDEMKWDW